MAVLHRPGHTPEQTAAVGDCWHLEQQGNLLAVAVKRAVLPEMPDDPRSEITTFTAAARMRLLKLLARVDWEAVGNCVFITLTYPDECIEETYAKRTQHRGQFVRDLRNYWDIPVCILWRVEWKPRLSGSLVGMLAPHLHLCAFTTRWLPKKLARDWWGRIIGHKEPLCWVRFRKGKRAAAYAAKYAAKEEGMSGLANNAYLNGVGTGRRWGVLKSEYLPLLPQRYVMGLSPAQEAQAQALAAQTLGIQHKGGFVVLTDEAEQLFDRIMGIGGTPIDVGDAFE